jgi:hypothetical protein
MQLQVLEPALVTSPPEIRRLAVVDRSRAKNVGQGILGVLEGAVTGEAIGADNAGRSRAMTALVTGLRNSPRFEAAESFLPKKELESSLFDTELSWGTAKSICKSADCQGIVALEAFDSDTTTNVRTEVETSTDDTGKEVSRTIFIADRQTRVTTAWRYYDVVNKGIIDDLRTWDTAYTWTQRHEVKDTAISMLPPQTDTVAHVGEMAGSAYARRIAPTYVWVTRSYYGSGDPTLKVGRNHVKAMDWPGAMDIWTDLHKNSPEPKVRGKAAFNLALAHEVRGDLRNAASWATEAAVLLANGRSRSYRALLDRRLADQVRLEEQMKMSAPGKIEEEKPAAKPAETGGRTKPPPPTRAGTGSSQGTGTSSGTGTTPPPSPRSGGNR